MGTQINIYINVVSTGVVMLILESITYHLWLVFFFFLWIMIVVLVSHFQVYEIGDVDVTIFAKIKLKQILFPC